MIKDFIQQLITQETGWSAGDIHVEKPKNNQADYAVNVFATAKKENISPDEIASNLAQKLTDQKPAEIEKIEASGGYVNFFLSRGYLQQELLHISKQKNYGTNETLKGKKIMVEYTDPNPFKLFHIGHLMSNTIGESIARLYEASGAKVIHANYQGDVGLHVAKAIWGAKQLLKSEDSESARRLILVGLGYAIGAKAYEGDEKAKAEIEDINRKLYDKSDSEINELYNKGREWSLEEFERDYKRLGTTFDRYFFESEVSDDGLEVIKSHKNIFVESVGAIVFKGEDYGLHTRVFVNSKGLPTYEAKELGLNKKKFELYPELAISIVVTGNEINEYFNVLLKVMSLVLPNVAEKTRHIGHGMMRLPSGKMSSRTGDVVTADLLIDQTKDKLKEKENEVLDNDTREAVAIGAIKYTILKQSPGKDIIFDFDTSLAVKGDSGPYLQYTYSRLHSIYQKAVQANFQFPISNFQTLMDESELNLIKHFIEFPDTVQESMELIAPQRLALYLFELANLANNFYEKIRILDDEDSGRMSARLLLVNTAASILSSGLSILGIKTPERI